jgi:phospholipid-binding lipoprotein MlaA
MRLPLPAVSMPLSLSVKINFRTGCVLIAIVLLSACTAPTPGTEFNDPYEASNRANYDIIKSVDRLVLRPVGQVAGAFPTEVTGRVASFADNVGLPSMVANGLLQGDVDGVAVNTMRFLINTTIGIGGLFDPAGVIGLVEKTTDFGETLAVWGVAEGAYLVLPVLGPSTERAAVGTLVDMLLNPLQNVGTAAQLDYAMGARIANLAIMRGAFMDTIDSVLYNSADSYAAARLAYLQNRRFELGVKPPAGNEIDPFSDELSLEGFE